MHATLPIPVPGADGCRRANSDPIARGSPSTSSRQSSQKRRYPEYLGQDELQSGLKRGHLLRGTFRVNVNDRSEGYVTIQGLPNDVFLKGAAQNRALHGDVVALQLDPVTSWRGLKRETSGTSAATTPPAGSSPPVGTPPFASTPPAPAPTLSTSPGAVARQHAVSALSFLNQIKLGWQGSQASPSSAPTAAPAAPVAPQDRPWEAARTLEEAMQLVSEQLSQRPNSRPTGRVVAILEATPRREVVVGVLSPAGDGRQVCLVPADTRLPSMSVTPQDLAKLPEELQVEASTPVVPRRTLVSARMVEWRADSSRPRAAVRQSIGQAGDIASETAALLMLEQVRTEEFTEEVVACLPQGPWAISQEELDARRDFRSTRIFSIDPPTARDLDDALSVERLPDGSLRIGVHIADVSHFVTPGTPLDEEAAIRSTSVYLVDRVIPMLPRLLCENLCSLNPGVERLAFSITWDMDPDGEVHAVWAGRSVIRSCAKLAYLHAQQMIDGAFDPAASGVELHDGYDWAEVQEDVRALHVVAAKLRAGRFAGGALKLDNRKLYFRLDEDGNPTEAQPYEQLDSHWLVEEMMLLANRTAAKITADAFPTLAVLRRHAPPDERKLLEMADLAQTLGVSLEIGSSHALQRGLEQLRASCQDPALAAALQNLATKPMQLAKYFCTGAVTESWRHYALAVDHYTHFTSPIRRYPDVLVHRLLAAALELGPPTPAGGPSAGEEEAQRVAAAHGLLASDACQLVTEHANARKLAARNVQDASSRLFLAVLLRDKPVVTQGVLLQPGGDRFVGAFLPDFGCECRLEYGQCTTPAYATFDREAAEVLLEAAPEVGAHDLMAPSQQSARRQASSGSHATAGPSSGRSADLDELAWAASLANLSNPQGLAPLPLPAQLRALHVVPLVVGAYVSSSVSGKPMDLAARLYTGEPLPAAP